jgi:cytoskeletal protein CcmA (bactofilin family)
MGSVKGRIEAVQVRIENGATVDADVIVDEAIIAGEFTGNLTCRQRLEARSSGRINGRVETFKLMLHEGASVEGEMHMLTEAPKDATSTIRGSAPVRGDTERENGSSGPDAAAAPAPKPAPAVAPASSAKPTTTVGPAGGGGTAAGSVSSSEASAVRSSVVETLKAERDRVVTPRTTSSTRGYGYSGPTDPSSAADSAAARSRGRGQNATTGF